MRKHLDLEITEYDIVNLKFSYVNSIYLGNHLGSTFNIPTHGEVLSTTQLVLEDVFAVAQWD